MDSSPLYIQIRDFISQKIQSGHWPVGHKITTEIELTKQFNVSRMTVNKAIRDLVSQGKLVRKPRAGTFVCEQIEKAQSPLLDIQNIAEEVKSRGNKYHNYVVHQQEIQADDRIATQLGIMLKKNVYYSKIIHFENDTPIQLELRWVNPQHAPDYLDQDFSTKTPNQYLSENCPLSAIEHTVEAVIPDQDVSHALSLLSEEPCLLLNRRTWSNESLVSTALLYHPASKYKLSSKILF
ncbi:histidine utilization repressor [Vibrio sp. 10N.261.55.A7]|uniref:histidine utilization repressor n=1 Tax=Vibrio sp. 10N.261.55.A7 TaxID=1880851 RepID=UPI000C82F24F|nr:histidine utilization repressor [Vibrio sp. 10N.261.55.A7]PMK02870.1 histidine utilization repressor [Vibrio sp. 10N.261.55.A7]